MLKSLLLMCVFTLAACATGAPSDKQGAPATKCSSNPPVCLPGLDRVCTADSNGCDHCKCVQQNKPTLPDAQKQITPSSGSINKN